MLALSLTSLAGDNVPWSQDFSEYNCIRPWPKASGNSKTRGITQSSQQLMMNQAPTSGSNDYYMWFTENGFNLEAGKSYRFDIDVRSNSSVGSRYFEILLYKKNGTATPAIADANTRVMKISDITEIYMSHSAYFEPDETAEYYLCLHGVSDYAGRALYWDNFKLVEASMDAPDKPSVAVTPDAGGILKAAVSVTAPTKTIRGDAITSMSKLVVLRDGGIIKEFTNPAAGQTYTFTDLVAQPGSHTYSAIAYNEKGAGAQFDATTIIGAEVQKETWHYKAIYGTDGKVRIEWPAKDGVAEYNVATTGGRVLTGTPVLDETSNTYFIIDDAFEKGTEPNGWQWVVSYNNDGGSAVKLGTTNYLCLNNEVPYYPAFNFDGSLDAFTKDRETEFAWQWSASGGGHAAGGVSRDYSTKQQYKSWLISPGLKLYKGKYYRVKLAIASNRGTVAYTIKAGRSNTREALDIMVTESHPTVMVDNNSNISNTDEMFLSVPEDGMYFIGLTGDIPDNTSSDQLNVERFDIFEVDGSLPDAPTDAAVAYSAAGGNDGKISFKVPEKAISGDAVTGLTKVEVYKDGELFKTLTDGVTPGATMSFDVEVVAGVQNVYTIMAFNAAGQGEPATVKVMVLSTPYSNDFNSKNSLEGYTIINHRDLAYTWHLQNGQARLFPTESGYDHWLITPPVTLQAGMYYILTFNAKALGDYGGELEVMLGKGAGEELLTQRVMETITLDKADNIFQGNREEYFTVEENGQYFLAFHVTSPEEERVRTSEVYLDDLMISAGVSGSMPDRGELKVTPAADGSLKAELSYTAATKCLDGTDLNANSTQNVYFYINGVQTPANRTFSAYPGQTVAITVEVPEDLPYIFSARTGWAGRVSYRDAFVGINRPGYPNPDKITIKETLPYGHVVMSWEAPQKDYEGYPLNPDLLTYDVAALKADIYGNPYEEEIFKGIKGTQCEFDALKDNSKQSMVRYVLRARNSRGEGSSGALSKYINVGKPYKMPYVESFINENGNPGASTAIFDECLEGMCRWGIMTDGLAGIKAADNDGAYIALESLFEGCVGRFYTGKVSLGSGMAPALTMMVHNPGTESLEARNTLEFKVYTYADSKWHSLGEPRSINEICGGKPGWNKVTLDLSDYADNVVVCAVEATCVSHTFTSLDNIRIWELPANDLSLQGHNAPLSVIPGQNFEVSVDVVNNGVAAATPENIEMLVDGEVVATADGTEIAVGSMETFKLSHAFPAVDLAASHELVFKVNFADDADLADNESAPHTILTVEGNLAPVSNVKGVADNNQVISLTWDAPTPAEGGVITETFEDWTPGVASQHGWTAFDRDGQDIRGVNDGSGNALVIPGLEAFAPASWALIDNANGSLPASSFPAKSGSKFLMSICPGGSTGSADDWMISPELSGNAQTVKFGVRNFSGYPVGVEVLCSDGEMNVTSFKSMAKGSINSSEWVESSVDLPEGTKRVAIRNISYCETSFMLMIDDITYEPAAQAQATLLGYNVYSEAECIASPEEAGYTFAEPSETGKHVFGVTARYAEGESALVPVEVDVESGLIGTVADGGIHVFGGEGCIHVTGATGRNVTVSTVGGIVICNGVIEDSRIAAAPGIYVVAVADKSYKVIVK